MVAKRGFILLVLLLILPLASATITITTTTNPVYNLGDTIPISTTVQTSATSSFNMDLVCGVNRTNFYKISVLSGESKTIESLLPLSKSIIGDLKGTCAMRAYFPADEKFTNDFKISDLINIQSNISKTDFNPGENLLVKGNAVKENGKSVNGFVELGILDGSSSVLTQKTTVNNGLFSVNATLPKDMRAGNYLVRLTAYEQDLSGETTNNGFLDQNIYIKQVPTNLEIIFENSDVEPGTNMKVKAVLHDQTGVTIDSLVFLTIKNSKDKILEQKEISIDEFLEFPIAYNEAPSSWKVVAVSRKLTSESSFNILEKEDAIVEIINKTVLITNTGNIPYNKTVLVKIGEQPININVYLKVSQSKLYVLTAPDGEYAIEVNADGTITGAVVALTGNSIDVKEASGGFVGFSVVWIFIIAIMGIGFFIIFKQGYPKTFIGYIGSRIPGKSKTLSADKTMDFIVHNPKSAKAELALSIKGDKQDVSMIILKVKNMLSVKHSKEGGGKEVLKKIIDFAESHKAATYESQDSIFFIFAPVRTKTFRNEQTALKVSQRIKEILDEHNKLFKQKMDYGISLNHGEIIAKQEPDSFKFMGIGNFMIQSKKISSVAENDILMGERMTDNLRNIVKVEKLRKEGLDMYAIKEIKDYEKHQRFLDGFMKRMDKGGI